jgi:RNA polymerase sigma-70 factor, ECF subfamily
MQSISVPPRPARITDDSALLAAVRSGDEAAFTALVDALSAGMLRMARAFVPSPAVAEEVVQETWLAVLRGVDRFEARSSIKTWVYRILINTAKTRGQRERRSVPLAEIGGDGPDGGALHAHHGPRASHREGPGRWAAGPAPWPDDAVVDCEVRNVVARAVEQLPRVQRTVISLRDIEGWSAEETCRTLGLSNGNQRVLLHRARTHVRAAIDVYLGAARPVEVAR